MKRLFWLLPLFALMLNSCVTNRRYVLMQKNDLNKKNLPKDSVVREYDLIPFDYKVQPNDLLSVRFNSVSPTEYNFFSQGSQTISTGNTATSLLLLGDLVDEQGEIPFPVVGKVKVSGLTVFEIQDKLQQIATQYLESPIVKVRLLNFRITVLGEVGNEGTITFNTNRVNMLDAIAQAGGLGELADRTNIKLIRQLGGTTQVQYINLLDENFMTSPNYYIHQNDVLIVPPLKQRTVRKYLASNLSLIVSTISFVLLILNLTK